VRSYPKPARDRRIPIVLGGNTDPALARVAAYGDGWYGFNLSKDEALDRLSSLSSRCLRAGRDPDTVETAVALRDGSPGDVPDLAEMGATELVVVGSPPADPGQAGLWVVDLARRWGVSDRQAEPPV